MDIQLYRITVSSALPKNQIISRAMEADTAVNRSGFTWRILTPDTDVRVIEDGRFLDGLLVKTKDKDVLRLIPDKKIFSSTSIPDSVGGSCYFTIDLKTALVAAQKKTEISSETFMKVVKKIFEAAHKNFFLDVRLEKVLDREDFVASVNNLDRITHFRATIHPSNPRFEPEWRSTSDDLRESGTGTLKVDFEPQDPQRGLEPKHGTSLLGMLYMVADGYGRGFVRGLRAGKRVVIDSLKKHRTITLTGAEAMEDTEIGHAIANALKNENPQ